MPGAFDAVAGVVFRHPRGEATALGVIRVDAAERTLRLSAVNPMGLRLFDVSAHGREASLESSLPGLAGGGRFASALAHDIRHTYLSLAPPDGARAVREGGCVLFTGTDGGDRVGHVVAGGRLVEKRVFAGRRLRTVIVYEGFETLSGRSFPTRITVENRRLGYRLEVRTREVRPADGGSGSPR